ncbi:MAG TPA: thiamine-phosphate kinase [Thermodesulfobacteriota bacterium]|nr:thiamine-phosphate kinase [Thermodesulfobacteriota bacterium]
MIDELSALIRIKGRFGNVSKGVHLGIGDDAAAVRINPENLLLATVDSQVEDVHFIKKLISTKDLARKSVAISASDIGAMGGIPKFFLASLGISKEEDEGFLEDLIEGFRRAEEEFGLELIGGNLSGSNKLFIDITVLGEVEPNIMVRRSGASPGDAIYVSGTLGDSALGLRVLRSGRRGEGDNYLVSRHVSPKPRLKLGRELAKRRLATAMIDISDGLILDLERITVGFGLGAEIEISRTPISSYYRERILDFVSEPYGLALSGGEDYELLFTSPKENREEIKEVSKSLDIDVTEIGCVTAEPRITVLDLDRKEIKFKERGFIHFNT